jgi:hypothetical protein
MEPNRITEFTEWMVEYRLFTDKIQEKYEEPYGWR